MGLARTTWEAVPAEYKAETLMAIKVDFGEKESWVPKSLIANLDPFIEGDDNELHVQSWWLMENNLL